MSFNVRSVDLAKLNSLTKYPSIPTYHTLDPKNGGLLEEAIPFDGEIVATEKVDGTNSRVICLPDGNYLLGSREELLYAKGDLIGNPAMGIAEALKPLAEQLTNETTNSITVYYLEVYGGKVTSNSKQYTGEQKVGFRLFDVACVIDYSALLTRPLAEISAWREAGGQEFVDETKLHQISEQYSINLTPRINTLSASELPTSVEAALQFLRNAITNTLCALDANAGGKPEGLVIRTLTRSRIAKLRFEDYERTIKRRK